MAFRGVEDLGELVFDGPHGQRIILPRHIPGRQDPPPTRAPRTEDLTLDRLIAIDCGAVPTDGEAESLGFLLEWPPAFFLRDDPPVHVEDGAIFICGDGENRSDRCLFCGAPATLLCDGPPTADSYSMTSCDAEMCAECAVEVHADEHLCPRCRPTKRARRGRT